MTSPETASFSDFAKLVGFKASYITQLKKEGRLVLTDDGRRVLVAESCQLIEQTRDPSKIGVAQRHAKARNAPAAATAPDQAEPPATAPADRPESTDGAEGAGDSKLANKHAERRAKAMADKEEALAEQAIRENRKSARELVEFREVQEFLASAVVNLRKAFERLPYDLAPELASLADETEIRTVLHRAVDERLRELGRQFATLRQEPAE